MKNLNKKGIAKVALSAVMSLALVVPSVFASSASSASSGIQLPEINTDAGKQNSGLISNILGLIQFVGVAIALGMLIVIGIQYVTASSTKKGEIKDTAINYLFGAVCIFAAAGILQGIKGLVAAVKA